MTEASKPTMAETTTEEKIEIVPQIDHHFDAEHYHTLGHVRLRDIDTNKIILTPAPSLDPNDPLKW
jgi:hypothetical protein